ncbi:GTP-sensing pleiotropic transcriptional regulator CodY [Clostridium sediminicola]|uniref:GTP-sensing pleiotropic transcriptional regulator CodY n=1 Tax=Clostridium sediminicola TaxID=3114879 RepID=UPI0031F1CA66
MTSELLEKMRLLNNKILQKSGVEHVGFQDICDTLSYLLGSNVYIINKKEKILGYSFNNSEYERADHIDQKRKDLSQYYNSKFMSIKKILHNIENNSRLTFDETKSSEIEGEYFIITPIIGNGESLGTIYLTRFKKKFDDIDQILAEYTATIVGLEMMRFRNEKLEEKSRKKAEAELVLSTLSYSEVEAIEHIFNELKGPEGRLVTSKIARKEGVTRSIIGNALRKCESAGVIKAKSLGAQGTHIKVLNEKLLCALRRLR